MSIGRKFDTSRKTSTKSESVAKKLSKFRTHGTSLFEFGYEQNMFASLRANTRSGGCFSCSAGDSICACIDSIHPKGSAILRRCDVRIGTATTRAIWPW